MINYLLGTNLLFACQAPFDAVINLGGDCQVAYQMQINGLRKYALPFDKLITQYDSLQKLLENKFEGFIDSSNFELVKNGQEKYILDKKYGTRLIHDFKLEEDFLRDYESIKDTYLRRIARLLNLFNESKNPLFIRKRVNKEQVIALKSLLHRVCPGKPIIILALDGTEEIKENWHVEDVRNFHLRQPVPYVWKGDTAAWQEIFRTAGLSLSSPKDSTSEI